MTYELFCRSVQGAGHIKKGMPCEDYGIKFENEDCKIFALGDGHGDANCPRSSFGSRAVCEIAVEELQLFAKEIKNQNWTERLFDKYEASALVNQLVRAIFGKWSCRVNDDFLENPLTEKEELEAKEYIDRYRRGERIEHIYGTTFIAGLQAENYLLLLQQGDGRCVVFDSEGNASQPIPWDDRCFSNITTSVCDADAVQSCRYHIIDLTQNPVIACVAGSDGVEDSFGFMDKMHAYYREKLAIACESGIAALEEHLEETLPSFSAMGSRDDVTICGLIDREHYRDKLDKFAAENEAVIVKDAIARAQERIDSMGPKLKYLEQKRADADAECSRLKKQYSDLEDECLGLKEDLDELRKKNRFLSGWSVKCIQRRMAEVLKEKTALEKELQASIDKKKLCDEEYHAYKQRYEGFVLAKQESEARYQALNTVGSAAGIEPKTASDTSDDGDSAAENVSEQSDSVDSAQGSTPEAESSAEEDASPENEKAEEAEESADTPVCPRDAEKDEAEDREMPSDGGQNADEDCDSADAADGDS